MSAVKEVKTYCCISRGRFYWGGRVVAVKWQIQVNRGWLTQRRKGWQAVRHVHVSHREEYIIYTTHGCVKKNTRRDKKKRTNLTGAHSCNHYICFFLERSGVGEWCFSQTSTRHSSGSLAFKEVGVCSRNSRILLQTAVQFHMEPILVLLLYRSALPILSPFLWTFTQTLRDTQFILFLNNSSGDIVTLLDPKGAHLHQRKPQTSQEEDELAAGTVE